MLLLNRAKARPAAPDISPNSRLQATSSATEVVAIARVGQPSDRRDAAAPSRRPRSTFTSPSTTETREPFIPRLTSKIVPFTDTRQSGVEISSRPSPLLGRLHHHRAAFQANRLAAPPFGNRKIAALRHLDQSTRRATATPRANPWPCESLRSRQSRRPQRAPSTR